MKKLYGKFRSELWKTVSRGDYLPSDVTRCHIRFLFRAHKAGF